MCSFASKENLENAVHVRVSPSQDIQHEVSSAAFGNFLDSQELINFESLRLTCCPTRDKKRNRSWAADRGVIGLTP